MIADSPIESKMDLNIQPIDVTQYQPPWQALNRFAISATFDNDHIDSNNPEFIRLAQQV